MWIYVVFCDEGVIGAFYDEVDALTCRDEVLYKTRSRVKINSVQVK